MANQKLELKHLAPYLPYDLKCQYQGIVNGDQLKKWDKEINLISHNDYYDYVKEYPRPEEVLSLKIGYIKSLNIYKHSWVCYLGIKTMGLKGFYNGVGFKPILRQFSDLNDLDLRRIISYLFRDTKMIRPQMDKISCNKGFITFFDLETRQSYVAVKPDKESIPVLNMSNSFDDYQIFFELHIDMFGLIEKGLAVDINTIEL